MKTHKQDIGNSIGEASIDWLNGQVYVDSSGNYKWATGPGKEHKRSSLTYWNKEVKTRFKTVNEFHTYAHDAWCHGCKDCPHSAA